MVQVEQRWSMDQLITGVEAGQWLQILRRNQFRVDSTYAHRAAFISALSMGASALGGLESLVYARRLAETRVDPAPLFILGHWRSGTTHLHNMLGRAPGHTYPTVFQCIFPTSFLLTGAILPKLTAGLLSETRTYDNVRQGWHEAAEDEIALAKLTGLSPYLAFMFPDHAERYERFVDLRGCAPDEVAAWKAAFELFVKKIMLATGGSRVVVKSCTHTARIPVLLEMFPDARFVHIHRDPYEVFASTLHMRSHTDWENFFHLPGRDVLELRREQTLRLGRRLFDRVLEDRALIPKDRLIELAYADLCGHELATVERVYDTFQFPGFDAARPVLASYVAGIEGYRRNRLSLDARSRDEVYDHWRPMFEAYGYTR